MSNIIAGLTIACCIGIGLCLAVIAIGELAFRLQRGMDRIGGLAFRLRSRVARRQENNNDR